MNRSAAFALGAFLTTGLALTGWKLTRRIPHGPVEDTSPLPAMIFSAEPAGLGELLKQGDTDVPLRQVKWVSAGEGCRVVQVATQTDRQRIGIWPQGGQASTVDIPKPAGISRGAFAFASLNSAMAIPGDLLLLLYRLNQDGPENNLLVAFDLKAGQTRWVHLGTGDHLALSPDWEGAWLWGAQGPQTWLPLALTRNEQPGSNPKRASAKAVDLPPEVGEVQDLLPLKNGAVAVAHAKGLAIYGGKEGWKQYPPPELPEGALRFPGAKPRLAWDGIHAWWQFQPGYLARLDRDGAPEDGDHACPAPKGDRIRDARLMRLLGSDTEGHLWFALAAPSLEQVKAAVPERHEQTPVGEIVSEDLPTVAADPTLTESWKPYLDAGLGRIYRWTPKTGRLEMCDWTASWPKTGEPAGLPQPQPGDVDPQAGGMLLQAGATRWWLPLKALGFARAD